MKLIEPEIEWRDIPGYEGIYSVSNTGLVRSEARIAMRTNGRKIPVTEKILRTTLNSDGYPSLNLYLNGKKQSCSVHRLVALTFLPNPENKKEVNHIDNQPTNNNVSNLEWCTHTENMQHAAKQGRLNALNPEQLENIKSLMEKGLTKKEISKVVGVCTQTLTKYFPTRNLANKLEQAAELLEDGLSRNEIAQRLGMGTGTLGKYFPYTKPEHPKLEQIKKLLDSGASLGEIARQLNVGRNTIKKYFPKN